MSVPETLDIDVRKWIDKVKFIQEHYDQLPEEGIKSFKELENYWREAAYDCNASRSYIAAFKKVLPYLGVNRAVGNAVKEFCELCSRYYTKSPDFYMAFQRQMRQQDQTVNPILSRSMIRPAPPAYFTPPVSSRSAVRLFEGSHTSPATRVQSTQRSRNTPNPPSLSVAPTASRQTVVRSYSDRTTISETHNDSVVHRNVSHRRGRVLRNTILGLGIVGAILYGLLIGIPTFTCRELIKRADTYSTEHNYAEAMATLNNALGYAKFEKDRKAIEACTQSVRNAQSQYVALLQSEIDLICSAYFSAGGYRLNRQSIQYLSRDEVWPVITKLQEKVDLLRQMEVDQTRCEEYERRVKILKQHFQF